MVERVDGLSPGVLGFRLSGAGALWEDVKAAGEIGLKHRSAWVFTPEEQSAARSWVVGSSAA